MHDKGFADGSWDADEVAAPARFSPVRIDDGDGAGSIWTSLFGLPLIRQETLIVAGTDDPIVPLVNAKLMYLLLPHATLHLHDGDHLELITNAAQLAPVIERFRNPTLSR
jgi:pimeloyl-ACP methyl ester carboxylesterase